MNAQFDLFADPPHWDEPELTIRQMRLLLARARRNLHTVPEPVRAAFGLAVNTYRNSFRYRYWNFIFRLPNKIFRWSIICPRLTGLALDQLQRCETADLPGVEIRRHGPMSVTLLALHVPGVGSLELRRTPNKYYAASYAPFRTCGLLPRFDDDSPHIALPYALWEPDINLNKPAHERNLK